MSIWISWNIDIRQSLNSRDRFPRRKFKNEARTNCSPGPILSPSTISFELHAKTVEEIGLEMCNFHNFGRSVTLTLTVDWVEITLVRNLVEVYPHTKLDQNLKNFFVEVRMDGWLPIYYDLKIDLLGKSVGGLIASSVIIPVIIICNIFTHSFQHFIMFLDTDMKFVTCINPNVVILLQPANT